MKKVKNKEFAKHFTLHWLGLTSNDNTRTTFLYNCSISYIFWMSIERFQIYSFIFFVQSLLTGLEIIIITDALNNRVSVVYNMRVLGHF